MTHLKIMAATVLLAATTLPTLSHADDPFDRIIRGVISGLHERPVWQGDWHRGNHRQFARNDDDDDGRHRGRGSNFSRHDDDDDDGRRGRGGNFSRNDDDDDGRGRGRGGRGGDDNDDDD